MTSLWKYLLVLHREQGLSALESPLDRLLYTVSATVERIILLFRPSNQRFFADFGPSAPVAPQGAMWLVPLLATAYTATASAKPALGGR